MPQLESCLFLIAVLTLMALIGFASVMLKSNGGRTNSSKDSSSAMAFQSMDRLALAR